jgi:hypothetical protein
LLMDVTPGASRVAGTHSAVLSPDLRGRWRLVPFRVNQDLAETQGAKLWDQVARAQPQGRHFVASHLEICPRMFRGDR